MEKINEPFFTTDLKQWCTPEDKELLAKLDTCIENALANLIEPKHPQQETDNI